MKRYEGSPAVVIERRKGTPDSPFSNMNESLVVTGDGKVLLSEIPNELNRIIVTSEDNITWYETTEGKIPENGFKVDYINKLVTFNTIHVGKQLHFKYLGEGNHYYSPHSIYTKLDENDSVVETLGGLIENGLGALDALEKLDEKLNEVTQATNNAISATNDTREVITEGNQVINTANEKIVEVDGKINEATTKISELNTKLDEATSTINDVKEQSASVENIITNGQNVIDNAQLLINEVKSVGKFNLTTPYKKNNTVLDNGSTWIALKDTLNNPLPVLPIVENTYWRLTAIHGSKGDKGDTGAALSILGRLTDASELPPTGQAGDAYTVNGELYVWSENTYAWENVGNIKGEKGDKGDTGENGESAYEVAVDNGFVGTSEEWLTSLKGERGEIGKMTKYEYTIPATSEGQTTLEIPLSTLSVDDDLLLVLNGTVLYSDTDYTISGSMVSLKQPVLDYTNSTFFVRVLKNVPKGSEIPTGDGSLLTDGSVTKQKLESSLQQDINTTTEHLAQIATTTKLGHMMVGENLEITPEGVLNALGSSAEIKPYNTGHLNDLKEFGAYSSLGGTVARGFPNEVSDLHKTLIEVFPTGDGWLLQRFTWWSNSKVNRYERGFYMNIWGDWHTMPTSVINTFNNAQATDAASAHLVMQVNNKIDAQTVLMPILSPFGSFAASLDPRFKVIGGAGGVKGYVKVANTLTSNHICSIPYEYAPSTDVPFTIRRVRGNATVVLNGLVNNGGAILVDSSQTNQLAIGDFVMFNFMYLYQN